MIFDSDIIIWFQCGAYSASNFIKDNKERFISAQTYMELMQGAQNKRQQQNIMDYLNEFDFTVLPITENISHRAQIYSEEYALLNGIRAGDAWIAATAMENNLTLANANAKHFRCTPNLKFKLFKPQVK